MIKIERCSDCGRFLGEDSFNFRIKKKGLRLPYCKRCACNRSYLWRLDNPEYGKQYRRDNKEYIAEYKKRWASDNSEQCNYRSKKWRLQNPGYNKQWCQDNTKLYRVSATKGNSKYKAKKRNQTPCLSNHELKKIDLYYQIGNYLGEDFEVDHIQPISKGGLHHPDNLQILSAHLNREKHSKYPLTEVEQSKYRGFTI